MQKQREGKIQTDKKPPTGIESEDIKVPSIEHVMAQIEYAIDPQKLLDKLKGKLKNMENKPRMICICGVPKCRIGEFVPTND